MTMAASPQGFAGLSQRAPVASWWFGPPCWSSRMFQSMKPVLQCSRSCVERTPHDRSGITGRLVTAIAPQQTWIMKVP